MSNTGQTKYHKCRWVITSPDGVSFSNLEEIKIVRSRNTSGRETRRVADKAHSTTITVNTKKDEPHEGSGQVLQYGEFMIQMTPYNKEWLTRSLKKEWIVMDDIDLERELLQDDSIEDTTFIEIESEPVMVEETVDSAKDSAKAAKKKERLDRLKVKVKATT